MIFDSHIDDELTLESIQKCTGSEVRIVMVGHEQGDVMCDIGGFYKYQIPTFDKESGTLTFHNSIANSIICTLECKKIGNEYDIVTSSISKCDAISTPEYDPRSWGVKKIEWSKYTHSLTVYKWEIGASMRVEHVLKNLTFLNFRGEDMRTILDFIRTQLANVESILNLRVSKVHSEDPVPALHPSTQNLYIMQFEASGDFDESLNTYLYKLYIANPNLRGVTIHTQDVVLQSDKELLMRVFETKYSKLSKKIRDEIDLYKI